MQDGKFHIEGDKIIKTSNGEAIPEDEPIWIVRGRDKLALPILYAYLKDSLDDNCTGYQIEGVKALIDRFARFADDYPERMKQPGITLGK